MKTTNFGTMLVLENVECNATPLPGKTYILKLIELINQAKFTIDIIQYQWNFYKNKEASPIQKFNRAVIEKARSGVKVRVILNKEGRGQHLMAINMKASGYLSDVGANVKFGRTFPITHAKLFVIDQELSILGSHNLSNRSVSVNNEVSILINNKQIAGEYLRYFNILWNLI